MIPLQYILFHTHIPDAAIGSHNKYALTLTRITHTHITRHNKYALTLTRITNIPLYYVTPSLTYVSPSTAFFRPIYWSFYFFLTFHFWPLPFPITHIRPFLNFFWAFSLILCLFYFFEAFPFSVSQIRSLFFGLLLIYPTSLYILQSWLLHFRRPSSQYQ